MIHEWEVLTRPSIFSMLNGVVMNRFTFGCVYGAALAGTLSFELIRGMNKEIKTLDAKLKIYNELIMTMQSVIEDAEDRLAEQNPEVYEEFAKDSKAKLEFFNVAQMVFV